MDSSLVDVLSGINCIASNYMAKTLVFANDFNQQDDDQILMIPYKALGTDYNSVGYSDITNRFILIQPDEIRTFTQVHALSPSRSIEAVITLILLHELGHFKLGKEGKFDMLPDVKASSGEMRMDTEPQYLTSIKRVELSADSIAIELVKQAAKSKQRSQTACFSTAVDMQLLLPGMEFQVFGTRLLTNFGSQDKILIDSSSTHPNLELRLAFMNYFLQPTPQKKQIIDAYLYNREVAPVHRQEFDPRIHQGQEKHLP